MFKKTIFVAIALVVTLATLVSCTSSLDKPTVKIDDVSIDSIDIEVSDTSRVFTAGDSYISEALFKYLYLYFKDGLLDQYAYYESMGYNVTNDANVKVGDTESFWNCKMSENEDGTIVTMKDYVYDTTLKIAKDVLALEKAATDYKFVYPDDYQEKLEAAIYSDVEAHGSAYLDANIEYADENGVVFDWVKTRREMYLASQGITAEEWERVFFMYQTVFAGNIQDHMEFVGAIVPAPEEDIRNEAIEYLKAQLEAYLTDNYKVDLIYFEYNDEASENSADVSEKEASESVSDDVSDDTSGEAVKETNEQILKRSEGVLAALKDGSLTVSEAIKQASDGDESEIIGKETLVQYLGDEVKDCKAGDIKLVDTDYGVYIVNFKEVTETDFGRTTEPTDEEMEDFRDLSLSDKLNNLLEKYTEVVEVNENIVAKYKCPWNIK